VGKRQRTKGAAYEREVARFFSAAFGQDFQRNIGQARDGGNDIDVGPLVVECKRRKNLKGMEDFLKQALAAAVERGQNPSIPVVVMRADEGQSMVLCALPDFVRMVTPWFDRESPAGGA
jgi:hypothetical protein